MAYTSQLEIQTYIYGTLLVPASTLDATLAADGLLAVYDYMAVPQNAAFDYLTIGDGYELKDDTLGNEGHQRGFQLYTTLHLWSVQRGTAKAASMVDRLNQLLLNKDNQPWTLTTLTHVYTMLNRVTYLLDAVGTIPVLHVAAQYKIYSVQS